MVLPASAAATAAVTAAAVAATTTAAAVATATSGLRLEAVVAVDGTIATWLEGNFRFLAAAATGGTEHFAVAAAKAAASAATTVRASGSPTRWTAAGFVGEPLGLMKFLLACRECERTATISAGQGFVGERHSTTSKKFPGSLRSSSTSENASLEEADGTRLPINSLPSFRSKKPAEILVLRI